VSVKLLRLGWLRLRVARSSNRTSSPAPCSSRCGTDTCRRSPSTTGTSGRAAGTGSSCCCGAGTAGTSSTRPAHGAHSAARATSTSRSSFLSVMAEQFEKRVILSGLGQSAVGRRLNRSELDLTVDACVDAVDDAGLQLSDIDGLVAWPGDVGYTGGLTAPYPG